MKESTTEIVIHLDEIGNFFNIPDPDPLAGNQLFEPGIDTVYDQVRASGVKSRPRLILYLPKNQVTSKNEIKLKNRDRRLLQIPDPQDPAKFGYAKTAGAKNAYLRINDLDHLPVIIRTRVLFNVYRPHCVLVRTGRVYVQRFHDHRLGQSVDTHLHAVI